MVGEAEKEVRTKSLQAAAAVTFYMVTSIGLVFLNRLVLTDKSEKAGALFVSWFQFIIAYLLIIIITVFFPNVPLLNLFPPLRYKAEIFVKVFPVTFAYLFMIGLNNKCLEYVSVSGYQIVRSLTIVFNIILTFFILGNKTSLRAILACGGVVIGFILGVEGELNLSIRGSIYGVLSSIFVALYSIVVKKVLDVLDKNEWLLIEYNTPIAIVSLAPFVWWSGEFEILKSRKSIRFWFLQSCAGVVGFIINISIFLNIKYTTPLTHNLSGTVKACLQTWLAFIVFPGSETMSTLKFIGTVLVIGFSGIYAYIRKKEMDNRTIAEIEAKLRAESDTNNQLMSQVPFEKVEPGE
jgi:GDP-fucose transporter C1